MDSGVDDLLELMELADIPRTREDYIAVAWGDDPPVPWTAELESELPEDLQDWSLFEVADDGAKLQEKRADDWMRREFNPDEPRDEDGKWTDGGGSDGGGSDSAGVEFVSPSVASHLDFHEAVSGLKSPQQKALREASAAIDEALHEKTTAYNIIGAWSDGAENSVASFHPNSDFERLRVSGAMKGHLADQKQVLIFQQHAGKTAGDAVLYNFEAKGSLADIHQNLLEDGIAFHTLVPNSGGATVLVADLDGSMADAVEKGSARYDAQVGVRFGQAEFIGTTKEDGSDREQRDSARASYEKIIAESPVQGSGETWRRIRDTYGEASVKPPAPAGEPQNNKIPHNLTADEKVARLVALTSENKPILDAAIKKIDAKYGTESTSDVKLPDRIKAKAERPSVLAAKPWFDVEYIRDSLRFKTIVDTFANTKPIIKELEDSGDFKVIKYDVGKVTNPKEWGWRMLPIDLQMKNGQIVEYYMVSKDQAAVAKEGHTIFEKWRNLDAAKFTPAQVKEYQADLAASQKLNGDAWQAYKDRTGQTESDFLASVTRDPTSSKSSTK